MRIVLTRIAAALGAVFLLTGSVVVSCSGDSPGTGGGDPADRPASRAFGQWTPPTAQGNERICSKEQHDRFFVVGPDGKRYPTWHPPTLTENGVTCSFAHDHGANPVTYADWDELRRHFAFDANGNGTADDSELASSGIPFGYVNEQATGAGAPLTEPHQSYKIVFVSDRLRTRQVNNLQATDVRCDLLLAFNQDTASNASFTNNAYSAIYAADCASNGSSTLPEYRAKVIASGLVRYGQASEIIAVAEAGSAAGRQVPTRERAYANILRTTNETSDYRRGLTERWNGQLVLTRADATPLASMDIGAGSIDPARYVESAAALTLRESIGLCYVALDAAGNEVTVGGVRQARGSTCTALPNGSGPTVPAGSRVQFGSPNSPFVGCKRSAYFSALTVRNNGGPRVWYTNIDGTGARTTTFAGALKQYVDLSDSGASVLIETDVTHEGWCIGNGLRAPN